MSEPKPRARKVPPCPVCSRPAEAAFKPFCSARCADVDLGRWLGERYVIPGPEDEALLERDDPGMRSKG